MKLNNVCNALFAAAIICAGAIPATVSAITIDGIVLPDGAYLQIGTIYEGKVDGPSGTITNYTSAIGAVGDELGGIGIVDAIKTGGGLTVWSSGDNGTQLTLQFGGYIAESITGSGPIDINFSGGWAKFYSDSVAISGLGYSAFNPSLVTADPTAVATATNGNLWLDTVGGPTGVLFGIIPITLQSHINDGTLLSIGSGSGNGFLNVVGGLAGPNLDTNSRALGNDITLGSSFSSDASTGSFFASGSLDLRGTAVTVPEPGTIALLGLGLLGMVVRLRRFN